MSDDHDHTPRALPQIRLVTEYCSPESLGFVPGTDRLPETLLDCLATLSVLALRDEKVVLVVSGQFVDSVKARLPESPYRDLYGTTRGAGIVGGKTLVVDDEVHVVMDAWTFYDPHVLASLGADPEIVDALRETTEYRGRLARRTAHHEAQHVAMEQSGEDSIDLEGLSWDRQSLLSLAHQVISEYRAELGVPVVLREQHQTDFPLDSLAALRADLRQIVLVDYQQHRDAAKLAYDVAQESHHLWKALAYVAAARRVFGFPIGGPAPDDVAAAEDWDLMAQPHWATLEALLSEIPMGKCA